jgi:hypothetical protein
LSSPFHQRYQPLAIWLAGERITEEKIVRIIIGIMYAAKTTASALGITCNLLCWSAWVRTVLLSIHRKHAPVMVGTRTAIAAFPQYLPSGRNGILTDEADDVMVAKKR